MNEMAAKDVYVRIREGKIEYQWVTKSVVTEGDLYSCYIPGFDLFFSAKSENQMMERGRQMMKTFFDYWVQEEGYKNFVLKIHKLGFKAPKHNFVIKQYLNKRPANAKFKMVNIDTPLGFENSREVEMEGELVA